MGTARGLGRGAVTLALGSLIIACTSIPSPAVYGTPGDGFKWCKQVLEAGDSVSAIDTGLFWVCTVAALAIAAVGAVLAHGHAESTDKAGEAAKWFAVLSGILAASCAAFAAYMNTRAQDADTARGTVQAIMARIPAPSAKNHAPEDYAAWQTCQLAAAAWRSSHQKALDHAIDQLDSARKKRDQVADDADEAKEQIERASEKTDKIASDASQAKDELKSAREEVAQAKEVARRAGATPVVEQLEKAETGLKEADSRVKDIETATKDVKSGTTKAADKLEQATKPPEPPPSRGRTRGEP